MRPDGSIANFVGKTFDKSIVKAKGLKYMVKTFTLPDVQVGSIIEYYYTLDLPEYFLFDSHWILSDELFTKSAKFSLKPYTGCPFGQIGGYLQSNYGLLVTPEGGELVELPNQPTATSSIHRTAKLTLDPTGRLHGDVQELRVGDRAWSERWVLRTVTKDTDRIKPIENLLAGSLANFRITKASIVNLQQTDQPFGFNYSFEVQNYAKSAGDLLLVRPRVFGIKGSAILETKEPRLEFRGGASVNITTSSRLRKSQQAQKQQQRQSTECAPDGMQSAPACEQLACLC